MAISELALHLRHQQIVNAEAEKQRASALLVDASQKVATSPEDSLARIQEATGIIAQTQPNVIEQKQQIIGDVFTEALAKLKAHGIEEPPVEWLRQNFGGVPEGETSTQQTSVTAIVTESVLRRSGPVDVGTLEQVVVAPEFLESVELTEDQAIAAVHDVVDALQPAAEPIHEHVAPAVKADEPHTTETIETQQPAEPVVEKVVTTEEAAPVRHFVKDLGEKQEEYVRGLLLTNIEQGNPPTTRQLAQEARRIRNLYADVSVIRYNVEKALSGAAEKLRKALENPEGRPYAQRLLQDLQAAYPDVEPEQFITALEKAGRHEAITREDIFGSAEKISAQAAAVIEAPAAEPEIIEASDIPVVITEPEVVAVETTTSPETVTESETVADEALVSEDVTTVEETVEVDTDEIQLTFETKGDKSILKFEGAEVQVSPRQRQMLENVGKSKANAVGRDEVYRAIWIGDFDRNKFSYTLSTLKKHLRESGAPITIAKLSGEGTNVVSSYYLERLQQESSRQAVVVNELPVVESTAPVVETLTVVTPDAAGIEIVTLGPIEVEARELEDFTSSEMYHLAAALIIAKQNILRGLGFMEGEIDAEDRNRLYDIAVANIPANIDDAATQSAVLDSMRQKALLYISAEYNNNPELSEDGKRLYELIEGAKSEDAIDRFVADYREAFSTSM